VIALVSISPDPGFEDDDLVCSVTLVDGDASEHSFRFDWFEDGGTLPIDEWTTSETQYSLTADLTVVGSTYRCEVTADIEVPVISGEVIVLDESCRADPASCLPPPGGM